MATSATATWALLIPDAHAHIATVFFAKKWCGPKGKLSFQTLEVQQERQRAGRLGKSGGRAAQGKHVPGMNNGRSLGK